MTAQLLGTLIVSTCVAVAVTCDIVAGTDYLKRIRETDKAYELWKRGTQ